jgi:hypothetical protein
MSTPKNQNLARRDTLTLSSGSSLIELEPDQLRAVIGGATKGPKIEVTVKPDGTIIIKVN